MKIQILTPLQSDLKNFYDLAMLTEIKRCFYIFINFVFMNPNYILCTPLYYILCTPLYCILCTPIFKLFNYSNHVSLFLSCRWLHVMKTYIYHIVDYFTFPIYPSVETIHITNYDLYCFLSFY